MCAFQGTKGLQPLYLYMLLFVYVLLPRDCQLVDGHVWHLLPGSCTNVLVLLHSHDPSATEEKCESLV